MVRRVLRLVAWAALATVAVTPATASAAKQIRAETVWRFDALTYTIDQGELVTFLNADAASPGPHDVTAHDNDVDGKPLFKSKTIPHGEEVPVTGVQQLKTGTYGFFCSVHTFMGGDLVVTDKGTPAPPPGGGAPPPATPPSPPADKQAPKVGAALAKTTLRKALRRRGFAVAITTDEAATLKLRLTARAGKRTVLVGTATGATDRRADLTVRIAKRAVRTLSRAKRVTLTLAVEARDGAGNVGTAVARRTVKR